MGMACNVCEDAGDVYVWKYWPLICRLHIQIVFFSSFWQNVYFFKYMFFEKVNWYVNVGSVMVNINVLSSLRHYRNNISLYTLLLGYTDMSFLTHKSTCLKL